MKFNSIKNNINTVFNHAGAKAYSLSPETELFTTVATAGLSDNFYEKSDEKLERIKALIAANDPVFVAKLAIYARNKMYMRSIPIVMLVELAKLNPGGSILRKSVGGVVKRADEITELLSYYQIANQRKDTKKLNKLSKQLQRGLGDVLNNFDEYQFAKYNRKTEVSLRDALFLVHPKPKNEDQQVIFNKLANDTLETPYTWETALSKVGQESYENPDARKLAFTKVWQELIDSDRLGYMALLRNLRNIIESDVSPMHIAKVCAILSDRAQVAKAKQFPFRFLSAYRELKDIKSVYTSILLQALENAIVASVVNIPGFDIQTRVLIACDVSGSMQKAVSPRSKVMLYDIGLVLGMLMHSKCTSVMTGMFGDTWKTISLPQSGILRNVDAFYKREGEVGYSTNGHLVIHDLIQKQKIMDKVMIFTDCQLWDSSGGGNTLSSAWKQYKKIAPNASLYIFDLAGYGQAPINIQSNDVFLIAGWSDKIFEIVDQIEKGESAMSYIKTIEL
jgi:60 kDa SS-A/Ro ribonucleoprotein